MKKIIFLIWLFIGITVLCGCMKASVVIPVDEKIGIKIETKDEEEPVIVNGSKSGHHNGLYE